MKKNIQRILQDWNLFEILFFCIGVTIEIVLFFIFKGEWYELIYVLLYFITALLMAKRKIICCIIGIVSTAFYAIVAFYQHYFGEMIVALLFTLPLMIFTLISWIKNKEKEDLDKVYPNIKRMRVELLCVIVSQIIASIGYYFLLDFFNTESIILSVLSVAISFVASWLSMRRNNYMFIGYVLNDIVLIILWAQPLATRDLSIIPIIFGQFLLLINDIYGFILWTKKVQAERNKMQIDKDYPCHP